MATVKRGCVVLLVTLAWTWACGGNKGTATAPSPSPTPTTTFSLSGKVRNAQTSASVSGATLSIVDGPNAGTSTTTDESGNYSFNALQQSGFNVNASAANYIQVSQGVTLLSNQTLNFSLRPQPAAITLSGRVTDAATGAPIAGAVVSINGRSRTTTDNSGNYRVAGLLDAGSHLDTTYVSAENYVADYRYIRGTIQNVRLYRIERIVAGESKLVTVAPDDTLCVNNMQDTPGIGPDYVCRSVFVVAPNDRPVTIEAVSTLDGAYPPLEVETRGVLPCCSERMGNPTTMEVTGGTVIVVNVEMPSSSTSPQSFVVNTSPSPH
jgi:hypothetical protein